MTRRINDVKTSKRNDAVLKESEQNTEKHEFLDFSEEHENFTSKDNDIATGFYPKQTLEEFTGSKVGKNIHSFGTLLMVSGIFGIFGCIYIITLGTWIIILALLVSLPINCYFLSIGGKIEGFQFAADELDDKIRTIVALSILNMFFGVSAFFSLFIWIDAYRYHKTWRHYYKLVTWHNISQEKRGKQK